MYTLSDFLREVLSPAEVYGLDLQIELHQALYPKSFRFLELAALCSTLSSSTHCNDVLDQLNHAYAQVVASCFAQQPKPNLFSFDGINGAGKSTLIQTVTDALNAENISVSITSSHVTRPYLLSALLKQVGVRLSNRPVAQVLIRLADIAFLELYHVHSGGDIGLFDRYIPSVVASEAANLKRNFSCSLDLSVQQLSSLIDEAFFVPYSFVLSVPLDVAIHRRERERQKAFSDLEMLSDVQSALQVYCEAKGITLIDGTLALDQLKSMILNKIIFLKV